VAGAGTGAGGGGAGLHRSLESDMKALLKGKSMADLETLEQEIQVKLEEGTTGDEEYWQAVLKKLEVELARAFVMDVYRAKLDKLGAGLGQGLDGGDGPGGAAAEMGGPEGIDGEGSRAFNPQYYEPAEDEFACGDDDNDGVEVVDEADDVEDLRARRIRAMRGEGAAEAGGGSGEGDAEQKKKALPTGDTDESFTQEVAIEKKIKWWHRKYQARKPRYFNRVHTGYQWTKYNQTHYDYDNPPPKVVTGYKFNIYYPDLIDRNEAPTYKIEKDPASPDYSTCIIRFQAGPPYEDIAFRVVNKDWEYGHKFGFKSSFERGVLHLHFNFKRSRYRK